MSRKRILQLAVLMIALAVVVLGGIGCSNDQQGSDTNGDTQQDTPLLTAAEAASLVYDYLDSRLYEDTYRSRLSRGYLSGVYLGQHEWRVYTGISGLGCWTVYERTGVVQPEDFKAQAIARSHFR